jgi:hypothetical protein
MVNGEVEVAEDFLEKDGDIMDKDDKRRLDYRPDIQYQEDYYSDYDGNIFGDSTDLDYDDNKENLYDQSYMDHIQDTINDLIQLIPNVTPELQTAINQVFKPIFNDWYKNLKKKKYPTSIPDPDTPIIIQPDPVGPSWPHPVPPDPPWFPTPPGGGGGGQDEDEDPIIKKPEPEIYIPNIDPPVIPEIIIPEPGNIDIGEIDDIFEPSTPWDIEYSTLTPVEIIELEYVKNLAELYNHYTSGLKKTIGKYYLTLFQASMSSSKVGDDSEELRSYFLDKISEEDAQANGDTNLKHLADAAVRYEIIGRNKLNFYTNMFSLESTLYHMKNFKAAYELRLRYEKEEMYDSENNENSMSNRMLTGSRENYNKKYDNAYINLYKYLNSSISVLTDVTNAHALSIKAKETLYKKGGTTK